ncbi:hypothetical protein ACLMJK_008556 [Lecanora helva]
MASLAPVELLRRQYLQLLDPEKLTMPSAELLRMPEIQAQMFDAMFKESGKMYLPPDRYRYRVLKRLVNALEDAIEDPDEDEISNDLSGALADYMVKTLPSSSEAAQQKSYITYTTPSSDQNAPQITLLESPSLLASSGTTGFRTWEAALFLGAYLSLPIGSDYVANRRIIELGAGTGFLSILCAKHLGASHVLATDGSQEVITDLQTNIEINALNKGDVILTSVLQWGHSLFNGAADCRDSGLIYDLAIGADVTYDIGSIPSLIATLRDLFDLYPKIQVLIPATVRNADTINNFTAACMQNGFIIRKLETTLCQSALQMGFFISTMSPIHMFLITREESAKDPFGL